MRYEISTQVMLPVHGDRDTVPPEWAIYVQRPARPDGAGTHQPCRNCDGKGKLERGADCRRCKGNGAAVFELAARFNFQSDDEERLAEVRAFVDKFRRLDLPPRIQTTVRLAESGGGMTNTGYATIICGVKGERLPCIAARGVSNGEHAIFWPRVALVVGYSHHRGVGSGTVTLVGVDRRAPQGIGVQVVPLWRFEDDNPEIRILSPEFLKHNEERETAALLFPTEAVEAARRKARTYHCRSAFYVASGGARGPSGAQSGAGAAFGGMPSPLKGPWRIGYTPS